jgi:hypothetical protein
MYIYIYIYIYIITSYVAAGVSLLSLVVCLYPSLPCRIGQEDVAEVLQDTQTIIDKGLVDGSRVGIIGGSHDGFLAAHMIGAPSG